MNTRAFAIAGPPASGKSTLLRVIPSIIKSSIAIDLELFESLVERRSVLDSMLRRTRNGILFFGVADVPFAEFADKGVDVIGLCTNDRDRYLERLKERNRADDKPDTDQSKHFCGCIRDLDLLRSKHQLKLEIDIFDARFEGNPVATAEFIAKEFSLPIYNSKECSDA